MGMSQRAIISKFADMLLSKDFSVIRDIMASPYRREQLGKALNAVANAPTEIDTASTQDLLDAMRDRLDCFLFIGEATGNDSSNVFIEAEGTLIEVLGLRSYAVDERIEDFLGTAPADRGSESVFDLDDEDEDYA